MTTHPEQRPFRFGLFLDVGDGRHDRLVETARRAEALGVDILLATDHLGSHAALPMLQATAEATGLRVGTMVLDNELRHPAVLAQELATVDAMTGGRLEIGLGAGWNRTELEAAGLPFDPPVDRVRRMKASLRMLRSALRDGRIDRGADAAYPGIHQHGLPKSVQRPHPPFVIGGGGPKLLAFAAREANIVGIDPRALPGGGSDPDDITEAAVERKIGWIREAAADRWAHLEIAITLFEVAGASKRGISDEELRRSPHYLVGETREMAETLLSRRERWGISYLALQPRQLEVMAPLIRAVKG